MRVSHRRSPPHQSFRHAAESPTHGVAPSGSAVTTARGRGHGHTGCRRGRRAGGCRRGRAAGGVDNAGELRQDMPCKVRKCWVLDDARQTLLRKQAQRLAVRLRPLIWLPNADCKKVVDVVCTSPELTEPLAEVCLPASLASGRHGGGDQCAAVPAAHQVALPVGGAAVCVVDRRALCVHAPVCEEDNDGHGVGARARRLVAVRLSNDVDYEPEVRCSILHPTVLQRNKNTDVSVKHLDSWFICDPLPPTDTTTTTTTTTHTHVFEKAA